MKNSQISKFGKLSNIMLWLKNTCSNTTTVWDISAEAHKLMAQIIDQNMAASTYNVSQKKSPPLRFSEIYSQMVGNF